MIFINSPSNNRNAYQLIGFVMFNWSVTTSKSEFQYYYLVFAVRIMTFSTNYMGHQFSLFNTLITQQKTGYNNLQPVSYYLIIYFFGNYFFISFLMVSPRTSSYISNLLFSSIIEFVPFTSFISGVVAICLFILIVLV